MELEIKEAGSNGDGPTVLTSKKSSEESPYRPGEADTVEWVEGLYSDAEQAKNDQCDPGTWEHDTDTYWGDQWTGNIPAFKPRIVVNEIKSLVLQELSDLTDSRIKTYVQENRDSAKQDELVEQSIEAFWKRYKGDLTMLNAALDAMIYPLGFLQSGWNPMAEQGQGQLFFKHRDPNTVFPDGDAEDDETRRFFLLEDVLDLVQIRRDFPETGIFVKPEDAYSIKKAQEQQRPSPRAGSGYMGPLYSKTGMAGVPGYRKARARMLTCVVEDDELKQEIIEIEGKLMRVSRQRYPNNRLIIIANRRVLYDEDCPYHHAPILTRVALQPTVHGYWPRKSTVNDYGEIQSAANKSDSLTVENALRLNAGEVFADADSGLSPSTYGGIPGMVYLIKPGSKVVKSYPNAMPADMVQTGERLRGFIRQNMGYPMSRTGAGTHGNVAAELAETEISQAMGMTRLRGRLLYQATADGVRMIFARMGQFYATPRHLTYTDQGSLKAIKWKPIAHPEDYIVHVDEDTFNIQSQTMMQRLHMALAKMGKMPTKRLLKALKIPDADKIADELKEELMLMALAKQKQPKAGKK